MSGQQFDSGVLRVLVPTGWKLFFGIDSSGNATPKKLHIYKNAETEADILYKPGITICYFGKMKSIFPQKISMIMSGTWNLSHWAAECGTAIPAQVWDILTRC